MTRSVGPEGLGDSVDADAGGRQRHAARLADLLDRSARGQEEAFAELYDATSSRIYGVVLKVLRSPDLAAEVTQEVYVESGGSPAGSRSSAAA